MKSQKYLIASAILILAITPSFASPNTQLIPVFGFSGTLDSVNIFINGMGVVPTGPISASQSGPSSMFLNFETGQIYNTYNLTIDVPLFDQLGLGHDTITVTESGTFNDDHVFIITETSGGGVSDRGVVADVNRDSQILLPATGTWQIPFDDLVLTFPASPIFGDNPQTVFTEGSGTFSTATPEPTTLLLVGSGLIGLLSRRKWFNAGSPR